MTQPQPERFQIVFEKLQEAITKELTVESVSPTELDEIDELRRFSAELSQPEPILFTTT
jgi:hypothetical protein